MSVYNNPYDYLKGSASVSHKIKRKTSSAARASTGRSNQTAGGRGGSKVVNKKIKNVDVGAVVVGEAEVAASVPPVGFEGQEEAAAALAADIDDGFSVVSHGRRRPKPKKKRKKKQTSTGAAQKTDENVPPSSSSSSEATTTATTASGGSSDSKKPTTVAKAVVVNKLSSSSPARQEKEVAAVRHVLEEKNRKEAPSSRDQKEDGDPPINPNPLTPPHTSSSSSAPRDCDQESVEDVTVVEAEEKGAPAPLHPPRKVMAPIVTNNGYPVYDQEPYPLVHAAPSNVQPRPVRAPSSSGAVQSRTHARPRLVQPPAVEQKQHHQAPSHQKQQRQQSAMHPRRPKTIKQYQPKVKQPQQQQQQQPQANQNRSNRVKRASPPKLSEREQLILEVRSWNPGTDAAVRSLNHWCDRLQKSSKGLNNFFQLFYEVRAIETIVRIILNSKSTHPNRFPAHRLKKLFSYCIYGTDTYHGWLLENLRDTCSHMEACRSRDELIEQALHVVSVLKVPPEDSDATSLLRHFQDPQLDRGYDQYEVWAKSWQDSERSFASYQSSYAQLSSLQKDLNHYAPTETVHRAFRDIQTRLEEMLQRFSADLQHQQTLHDHNKQRSKNWTMKNQEQILPVKANIEQVGSTLALLHRKKLHHETELQKINREISQLADKKIELENVHEHRTQELTAEYNTIKSEELRVVRSIDSQEKNRGCTQDLHSFVAHCEQQLFENARQKIEQFTSRRERRWTEYLDATYKHLHELVRLLQQRENRIAQVHGIIASLNSIGFGEDDVANHPVQLRLTQDSAAIESIRREVEDIVDHVLQLVSPESEIFQLFLVNIESMSHVLQLQKLLRYKKEEQPAPVVPSYNEQTVQSQPRSPNPSIEQQQQFPLVRAPNSPLPLVLPPSTSSAQTEPSDLPNGISSVPSSSAASVSSISSATSFDAHAAHLSTEAADSVLPPSDNNTVLSPSSSPVPSQPQPQPLSPPSPIDGDLSIPPVPSSSSPVPPVSSPVPPVSSPVPPISSPVPPVSFPVPSSPSSANALNQELVNSEDLPPLLPVSPVLPTVAAVSVLEEEPSSTSSPSPVSSPNLDQPRQPEQQEQQPSSPPPGDQPDQPFNEPAELAVNSEQPQEEEEKVEPQQQPQQEEVDDVAEVEEVVVAVDEPSSDTQQPSPSPPDVSDEDSAPPVDPPVDVAPPKPPATKVAASPWRKVVCEEPSEPVVSLEEFPPFAVNTTSSAPAVSQGTSWAAKTQKTQKLNGKPRGRRKPAAKLS